MNSKGFSLLEVMIAGAILVIGIVGLLPAFSSGMKHNIRAKSWIEVASLGQEIIEKIKTGIFVPDSGKKGRYSWSISKSDADLPGVEAGQLKRYLVNISWADGANIRHEKFLYLKKGEE